MDSPSTHWQRILGDGLIYDGPCLVKHIIVYPDANNDYSDLYDGRDVTSGTKLCRVATANRTTTHFNLGSGILFGKGIYVDAKDAAIETTIAFCPCEA